MILLVKATAKVTVIVLIIAIRLGSKHEEPRIRRGGGSDHLMRWTRCVLGLPLMCRASRSLAMLNRLGSMQIPRASVDLSSLCTALHCCGFEYGRPKFTFLTHQFLLTPPPTRARFPCRPTCSATLLCVSHPHPIRDEAQKAYVIGVVELGFGLLDA